MCAGAHRTEHRGIENEGDAMSEAKRSAGRTNATLRGDQTRDRLLDAIEAITAEAGFHGLSHRAIARRARLHTALVHYHFGTVERLLAEAVARRAQRLSQAQLAALSAVTARVRWTVDDVIAALWQPFSAIGGAIDEGWRNYLCLVARLANDRRGEESLPLYFGEVEQASLRALRSALPEADEPALRIGLDHTRVLFEHEALSRCSSALSPERRALDDRRIVAFAAAGMRSLASLSAGPPLYVRAAS